MVLNNRLKIFPFMVAVLAFLTVVGLPAQEVPDFNDDYQYDFDFNFDLLSIPETIIEAGEGFAPVTGAYGKLVVREGRWTAESAIKPWSSWWYPYWKNDYFVEGDVRSILWRYDRYVAKVTGTSPNSEIYEKEHLYFPEQARWSGRCDAWAMASIMEPEPKTESIVKGIRFRVRDQKSLLIKIYEKIEATRMFGQRNNGDWDTMYADVFPDQFHRFMQAELFEKKNPFLMDHDPGVEVWNVPVWKAQVTIKKDAANPGVVHVNNVVSYASPHVDNLDFVGTEGVMRIYTYDLFGEWKPNGDFVVSYGKWTGNSRKDHPDYLIPRPTSLVHSSLNEKIKTDYVRKIITEAKASPVN